MTFLQTKESRDRREEPCGAHHKIDKEQWEVKVLRDTRRLKNNK